MEFTEEDVCKLFDDEETNNTSATIPSNNDDITILFSVNDKTTNNSSLAKIQCLPNGFNVNGKRSPSNTTHNVFVSDQLRVQLFKPLDIEGSLVCQLFINETLHTEKTFNELHECSLTIPRCNKGGSNGKSRIGYLKLVQKQDEQKLVGLSNNFWIRTKTRKETVTNDKKTTEDKKLKKREYEEDSESSYSSDSKRKKQPTSDIINNEQTHSLFEENQGLKKRIAELEKLVSDILTGKLDQIPMTAQNPAISQSTLKTTKPRPSPLSVPTLLTSNTFGMCSPTNLMTSSCSSPGLEMSPTFFMTSPPRTGFEDYPSNYSFDDIDFFSPSGRAQDLQTGNNNNNQQTSSSGGGGFLTNTAIGSSAGGSSNIHTIPQAESGYHIEDPIHIKVKNWFLYFPLCSNIVFCVCIILYIVQGVFNEPKSSDICYRYSTTILNTKVWQLFTFPFFHGSITHILFNMLALYQFGNRIESTLGTIYFFFVSLFMIIFGSAVWVAIDALFIQGFGAGQALSFLLDRCTVGYSGVLFGYLVFTVQYRPLFEQLYPGANADDFAPKLIPWLMLIVTSLLMPNVSLMGHLTGMISGYLVWLLVRFVTPINKVFLFIDKKIPKFIRDRSFYFVSNEAVFASATVSRQTNQQDAQSTPSQPSSGGGFMSSISGWFRGGNNNNSNDQTTNNHSWGSNGRRLGN